MNKKYVLVEVINREIEGIVFDTFKDAHDAMEEAYNEHVETGIIEGDIDEWWAFATTIWHNDIDWKIIEI